MNATAVDDEVELVRETARALLAVECGDLGAGPGAGNGGGADAAPGWRGLWTTLAGSGWAGIGLPQGGGWDGLGMVGLVALLEEAGRYIVPAPLLSTAGMYVPLIAGTALAGDGTTACRRLLDPVLVGGRPATVALGERSRGTATEGQRPVWDGRRLRGTSLRVPDADRAELLAVVADVAEGGVPVVVVVEVGAPGVDLVPGPGADPFRPLGTLHLDAEPDAGWVLHGDIDRGLAAASVAVAAELVGIAQRCVDMSARHATDRVQFGRPIGSYQGVKHRIVNDAVATEEARSLVGAAAVALDAGAEVDASVLERAVAMATAAACEAGAGAATSGVQVHGALAMSWEYPLHLYLRRAWQDAALLGGPTLHYETVAASEIGARRAAP